MPDVPRLLRVYGAAAAVLALDQLTKALVRSHVPLGHTLELTPFFALRHVINRGGAFSFLYGQVPLLAVVAIAVAVGIVIYERTRRTLSGGQAVALGILLGGTVGNLLDRLIAGQVTDFLDVHLGPHRWPTFNVADVAINLGVAALVVGTALARPSTEELQR